jgi:SsrA-binding protein
MKNRKAFYNYTIEEQYTAGVILKGDEVKSIRNGKCNFTDPFCVITSNSIILKGLYVNKNNQFSPEETRDKTLLLNSKEINKIRNKFVVKGYTLIPLELIFVKGLVKIVIGVAKGRKTYDKKDVIKYKDIERDTKRELKNYK